MVYACETFQHFLIKKFFLQKALRNSLFISKVNKIKFNDNNEYNNNDVNVV